MDKQQLLEAVRIMASQSVIQKSELISAFDAGNPSASGTSRSKIGVANVLYGIGAMIVLIGIIVLIVTNWREFNSIAKILVTLGSAIAAYVVGVLLPAGDKKLDIAGQAFFVVSAILLPIGLLVTYDVMGIDIGTIGTQISISLIGFVVYLLSFVFLRRTLFTLLSLAFGTWLFYAIMLKFLTENPSFFTSNVIAYITMAVGIAYALIGYGFSNGARQRLSQGLYALGAMGFLGAAITLSGFWEIIYVGLVFGVLMISVALKSKMLLRIAALFIMADILKLTGEYFADSVGWPVALIVAGLALIGVGYGTVRVSSKYISSPAV